LSGSSITELRCTCGAVAASGQFSCSRRGTDDADHVLTLPPPAAWQVDDDPNPLIRYRRMLTGWQIATAAGLSDDAYVRIVRELDDAVAAIDYGRRFKVSPVVDAPGIIDAHLTVKNETGNVSGSHKSRHLAGIMVHLLAQEELGDELRGGEQTRAPLAIASCGNAALGAAVVAAAARWPLQVFVPPDGDALVLERLRALGADVQLCERLPDAPAGDPCYHRFQSAVAAGAIPFGCQGPDNGFTIDAGRTLGWEIAEQVPDVTRVLLQVGGAALASSVAQGLASAAALGVIGRMPTIDTVQVEACAPLARAYHATEKLGGIDAARQHRSQVMWPWEDVESSIAYGILDDETYDWARAVEAMFATDGTPMVITDDWVQKAWSQAPEVTGLTPCTTGASGFAGLLAMNESGAIGVDEHVVVIFTGIDRDVEATTVAAAS